MVQGGSVLEIVGVNQDLNVEAVYVETSQQPPQQSTAPLAVILLAAATIAVAT